MALVIRAAALITNEHEVTQNGVTFDALGAVRDGAIAIEKGRVAWSGAIDAMPERFRDAELHEYPECVAFPGFVDAHVHPLFAGDREPDFASRLRGEKPALGMLYTVERTRNALDDAESFRDLVAARLHAMLLHGTTTMECKTGYALHKPGEMQLLDLIADLCHPELVLPPGQYAPRVRRSAIEGRPSLPRAAAASTGSAVLRHAQHDTMARRDTMAQGDTVTALPNLIPTFLGAHALPPEFFNERDFIDYLIDQCLPFAKSHGAVYADAFCEPGFFSPEETRRYLQAARENGLRLRVHCDEMAYGAAAAMAVDLGVDAVDHCNCITDEDVDAIAGSDIVTVACPATISYLDLSPTAPARQLLERGGTVALASDYNPGTSPCFNLQTVAYFGRKIFGLTAAEALYGVTNAAARSLQSSAGTLQAGANADVVILQLGSPDEFGWQFGGNLARAVYRAGALCS